MQRANRQFGRLVLLMTLASGLAFASPAGVSGIVRDSQGVAQMGAMVQVLTANSSSVATAFTDMYGRYKFTDLLPGRYQIRATAALFLPTTRANLMLAMGTRATVNLTLSMLADTAAWLPAERRKPGEPGDDWTWTLKSAANRPILRMMQDGDMVLVSSSATENAQKASSVAHTSMTSGDGGFGGGGVHTVLALDRVAEDGSDVVLRTDFAAARTPYGRGPATEIDAGYERRSLLAGASRMVASYQSHPEMMSAGNALGMQMLRLASAEKMKFGEFADVEAGGTVYAVRTTGTTATAQPFLRVTLHPGKVWAVRYRLATSRDLQSFDGLDTVEAAVPMVAMVGGRLQAESGQHQEFAVSRRLGRGVVQAAVYRDGISHPVIAGTGVMGLADMSATGHSSTVVADTVTDGFQFLGAGYATRGMEVTVSEPLTTALWAMASYESGAALSTRDAVPTTLPQLTAGLHTEAAKSLTAAIKGRVIRSGTTLRASYRWQPRRLVTPVGEYDAFSDQAFLSFNARQPIRWSGVLPPGLEATVDVTNLLAQGYQPFLSADGRTLFLAQSPRTLQCGLSITF